MAGTQVDVPTHRRIGRAGWRCHEHATLDVGTNLDQQGLAGPNEPLARRERAKVPRAAAITSAGRSRFLRDIWLGPERSEDALENLCRLDRLRQIDPASDQLFVVGDSNEQPTRLFSRCGKVRVLYRFGGDFARFRVAVGSGVRVITGSGAQSMRKPVLLRSVAGSFDPGRCMQMRVMPIMGVRQEGCAAKGPQNQDRDQHHRENATSPLRPNDSVRGKAASGGWAEGHRHRGYRSGSNPSMTVSEPRLGRFPIKVEPVAASHEARDARLD